MSVDDHIHKSFFMFNKALFSLFIMCCSMQVAQSQNIIYSYSFDNDQEGWESNSISNLGIWNWEPDGKADLGTYWYDRPPIDETSNGALVYDGDYIISSNQGDTTLNYETAMLSPKLDFSTNSVVFLKFNQYYRNYDTNTSLEISVDNGVHWSSIPLNEQVKRNVETNPKAYEVIDISSYVAHQPDVHIRFLFEGRFYFWILDDIELYDAQPVIPTSPPYIGEYLTLHGYPYEVDDAGWPYIKRQAVVNFAPGTPESVKDQIRDEAGAIKLESCVCNTLETWEFVDSLLQGAIGLSSLGPQTGADQQVSTSNSTSEIDDIDFNKYVQSELTEGPFIQPSIFDILAAHTTSKIKKKIKIAIVDTGVDILHEHLGQWINLSGDIPNNEQDDNENCYVDDVVGWNFVDDNNNASDDHGHGSHVAGIVADYTMPFQSKGNIEIVPYKTHDDRGLANLFNVTCAMYQSIEDDISVVNCSWGFYGNESQVLKNAMLYAYDHKITIVAASGNDSLFLMDMQQYPACYKLPNLISVGSYNFEKRSETIVNSPFSNYGSKFVDVLAPGVDVLSTVPYNAFDYKTGTSMAAPVVSAIAALKYLNGYTDPEDVKHIILEEAQDHDYLSFEVLNGNVLLFEGTDTETPVDDGFYRTDGMNMSINSSKLTNDRKLEVKIDDQGSQLKITFQKDYQTVKAYVINSQGQIFMHKDLKALRQGSVEILDKGNLPAGLYFLRLNEKVYEFAVF